MKKLQLYVIPAGVCFVDRLADYLLERYADRHEDLARLRILLPSRRATRSLREAFLRTTAGKPLLLPQMHPIGEFDSDEILFAAQTDEKLAAELLSMPQPIAKLRLIMVLTRLIWQKNEKSRLKQSTQMAIELARLLDAVEREELSFANLKNLVADEYALHWQQTLEFLEIISSALPQYLAENGQIGAVEHRSKLLRLLARQWQITPPDYPVIAAGTTGSVPATAELLRSIAQMPQGMVILPGLDLDMPEEQWQRLEESHPQYGLKHLLSGMGAKRDDVECLPQCQLQQQQEHISARLTLLRYALQPAEFTAQWSQLQLPQDATAGLRMISCESVQQEALVISLLMREALEHPAKTAALVTTDRTLARRVTSALRRYGITIDDSAGMPLTNTPAAVFLRLVAEMANSRAAPVPLLSLLKHPLAGLGKSQGWVRETTRRLELMALRGVRRYEGLVSLREYINACIDNGKKEKGENKSKDEKALHDCLTLLDGLIDICTPFFEHFEGSAAYAPPREIAFSELLELHVQCAEHLAATDEESGDKRLWHGDNGQQLAAVLLEIKEAVQDFPPIDPAAYVGTIEVLLASAIWRPKYGTHPRLHILSPMEARLQQYDLLILGGLNEGSWPATVPADPWMSRPMRKSFGLPLQERAIGQSAHDFYMLAANSEVVLTRADKSAGVMTIPSRWWARLQVVLQKTGHADTAKDERWNYWSALLDKVQTATPISPPAPCPPVNMRPRRLSVTQIEKLLRDPYSVYARHILGLKKLDPLDAAPRAVDFGNFVHSALENFVARYPKELPPDPQEALLRCSEEIIDTRVGKSATATIWRTKFAQIASWLIAQERERRHHITKILTEKWGQYAFSAPAGDFTVSARADRIELRRDGGLFIIDYKTGSAPQTKHIELGISPQLLLEAVIAIKGGFADIDPVDAAGCNIEYWSLPTGKSGGKITPVKKVAELTKEAEQGVYTLISAFDDPGHPYLVQPLPYAKSRYNDYSHLARIAEWQG